MTDQTPPIKAPTPSDIPTISLEDVVRDATADCVRKLRDAEGEEMLNTPCDAIQIIESASKGVAKLVSSTGWSPEDQSKALVASTHRLASGANSSLKRMKKKFRVTIDPVFRGVWVDVNDRAEPKKGDS